MTPNRIVSCLICLLLAGAVQAQQAPPAAAPPAANAAPAGADGEEEAGDQDDRAWRDTSAYPFGALAGTALRLELVAKAMQLRDYCADRRVQDEFVRERLRRFSALSGRPEDCRSLLDY